MKSILQYPHVYYRGFPDLAFWKINPNTDNSSNIDHRRNDNKPWINDTFIAVEVKSENDHLSSYQEAVNDMLNNANIPIEVFKVRDSH